MNPSCDIDPGEWRGPGGAPTSTGPWRRAGQLGRPSLRPGPHTAALSIPGVVSLTSDETRVANALWITTHGAVVLELAIGIHDGWESNDEMFDWIVTSNIHRLLG